MIDAPAVDRVSFPAIGTTATLVVTEPARLSAAERVLRAELAAIDLACSRFRADSEITGLHARAGTETAVSPLLFEALSVAIRAARLTGGAVDPTVGQAVVDLGYDRDYAALADLPPREPGPAPAEPRPVPGWWRIILSENGSGGTVLLPRRVRLDLGATAKALAADRIARAAGATTGCGVLVNLGGDIATAGPAPDGGWRIGIADDHRVATSTPDTRVTIGSGGLATSSTTCRGWQRGGRAVHHIVDPTTGDIPPRVWRTVTVTAGSCVDANTASTAAVVFGRSAPDWLAERGLPARLVGEDGHIRTVAGWPVDGDLGGPAGRDVGGPTDHGSGESG